jgi:hypothetical protein
MRRLLALLLWLPAWPACAADLWDQLGPAKIGAARAEIAAPMTCGPAGDGHGQVCTASPGTGVTFAGLPVRAVELRFAEERLVRVAVKLSEQHYRALLTFLGTQFGASDDRSFRARGGMAMAEFEAGVHLWEHAGVSLVLEQFAGKIDRSVLTYGSAAAMADLVRSKTSYPRGARRDL